MEYLFYYMSPTPNKIWEDKGSQNQQISVTTQDFFVETELKTNVIS